MTIREKYLELLHKMRRDPENEPDDYAFIEGRMNILSEYVATVFVMQIGMTVVHDRFIGDDVAEYIEKLDHTRHDKHDMAITAATQLNRFCDRYGVERIFDGDINSRQEVAEFCIQAVDDIFANRSINRK